jgi:hypothetical protein
MSGEEFDATFEMTDAPEEEDSDGDDGEADADEALKEDPDDQLVRQKKRREERAASARAKENLLKM